MDLQMFVTATLAMVYFTVFVQGITIKPVVLFFKVKKRTETVPSLTEKITNRLMDGAKVNWLNIVPANRMQKLTLSQFKVLVCYRWRPDRSDRRYELS